MVNLNYADTPTPRTDEAWRALSNEQRVEALNRCLVHMGRSRWLVESAGSDGRVVLRCTTDMPAGHRGLILLDIEELFSSLTPGLTVWLKPAGDKNALRLLRGIEVKA